MSSQCLTNGLSALRISAIAVVVAVSDGRAWSQDPVVLMGHEGAITMGRFTPDGRSVVTSGTDTTVRVWNAAAGTELRQYRQHTGPVYCLDISSNAQILATGAQDNSVRLWDLLPATPMQTTALNDKHVAGMALSPDGRILLVAGQNGLTELASMSASSQTEQSPGALPKSRAAAGSNLTSINWRSDGAFFITGDATGTVRLGTPFLQETLLEFRAHECGLAGAWFYGTNSAAVTAGVDGEIRVWQLAEALAPGTPDDVPKPDAGLLTSQRTFRPGLKPIVAVTVFNNGTQILTVDDDGRVVLSDVNSGSVVREFQPESGTCRCVAVRSDNQRVACGTAEGTVEVWNAGNAELLQTLELQAPVSRLAFSRDNLKLTVAEGTHGVHVYGPSLPDQPRQELVLHQTIPAEGRIMDLTFSSDGRVIHLCDEGGNLSDWICAAPTQLRQLNHGGAVYGVAVTHDSKTVVSCGADQTVRVWQADTGQQRFQMSGHQGAVLTVAINSDDTLAVSAGADGTIRLWDLVGGRQLKQLTRLDATMYTLAIGPNDKYVAAAGDDRKIRFIDLVTGEVNRELEGHTDYIHSVDFKSSADRQLLSYGYAGYLKTWNPADGRELSSQRIGQIGNFAQFSPDGSRILLSNGDGTARIIPSP